MSVFFMPIRSVVKRQSESVIREVMQLIRSHSMARFWPVLFCFLISACSGEENFGSEHLIRVGERVVTVFDFNQAFELSETSHTFGLQDHPAQYRQAQERLLNEMTTELLMLARADELNLVVSEQELESKIAEIKADYPDETFEETLLEAAVPFEVWKQRLKVRLLLEKVIASELQNQMAITPKDIKTHYEKYYKLKPDDGSAAVDESRRAVDNEAIIRDLRRRKAEDAYDAWLEGLKARYPVEVNVAVWDKLSAAGHKSGANEETEPPDTQ